MSILRDGKPVPYNTICHMLKTTSDTKNSHRKYCKVKITISCNSKFSTGCGKECGKINLTVLCRVTPLHYKLYKPLFNILWCSNKRNGFSTNLSRFFPLSTNTFHQSCPFFNMVKNVSTFQLFINRQAVKFQSLSQTAFEWLFNTSDTPYCYCCLITII